MASILPLIVWFMFATGLFADSQEWHFSGPNIALQKNASQSSDHNTALAGRAVDGNKNTDVNGYSCTHTEIEQDNAYASWTVYLNRNYTVSGIIIYNRNELRDRLKNFQVIGDPGNFTLYNDTGKDNYKKEAISITVDGFRTYSSITVWLSGPSGLSSDTGPVLTLCEVQIYAACRPLTVSNGTYSPAHDGYGFGSVITVTCDKGYNIYGSNQSKCQGDGSWGDTNGNSSSFVTTPQCNLITCLWPTEISGGHYNNTVVNTAPYGTVIHASCNDDLYIFTGNRSRTCGEDSTWNGEAPKCAKATDEQGGSAAVIAGSAAGAVILIAVAVVLAVVIYRKRRALTNTESVSKQDAARTTSEIGTPNPDGEYENVMESEFGEYENRIELESINRNEETSQHEYESTVPANLKEHVYSDLNSSDAESKAEKVDSKNDYFKRRSVRRRYTRALTNAESVSKQDAARTTSEIGTPNPDGEYESIMESELGAYENRIELESINRSFTPDNHVYFFEKSLVRGVDDGDHKLYCCPSPESKAEKVDSKNDYVNLNLNNK